MARRGLAMDIRFEDCGTGWEICEGELRCGEGLGGMNSIIAICWKMFRPRNMQVGA